MSNSQLDIKLLTLERAAEMLQLSKRTILRMIYNKEFPAFKVGSQWRIRESQLEKWLEGKEPCSAGDSKDDFKIGLPVSRL